MKDRFTGAREALIATALFAGVACDKASVPNVSPSVTSTPGIEQKTTISELPVSPNQLYVLRASKEPSLSRVGLEEIRLFRDLETNYTLVAFIPNKESSVVKGAKAKASGLIPSDLNLDLQDSVAKVDADAKSDKPKDFRQKHLIEILSAMGFDQNKDSVVIFHTPTDLRNYKLVIGEGITINNNTQSSSPAIIIEAPLKFPLINNNNPRA